MKRKYLFLLRSTGIGGAEQVQMDYLLHIDYARFSATLGVTKDDGVFSSRLKEHNVPVDVILLPEPRLKEGFFRQFIRYYRFFRRINPDCIVLNQFFLNSFSLAETFAAFLATRGKIYNFVHDCPPLPVVDTKKASFRTSRGRDFFLRRERICRTLTGYLAQKTLAVSRESCRTLTARYGFPVSKVRVVYHGVDVQKYAPAGPERDRFRQDLGLGPGDIVIVSTARLQYPKRTGWLIEAFAESARGRRDIHLLIAGTGEEKKWLVTMARSFDSTIRERIRFLGYRKDIPAVLQASDIFVLPSETEGLSIACMEAMASGLVCIATDCGGMSELIHDGITGFLVAKSRGGVREGLHTALALTPEERDMLRQNSRKYILDNFNLEENIRSGFSVLGLGDR